jgi:hypothetical protein
VQEQDEIARRRLDSQGGRGGRAGPASLQYLDGRTALPQTVDERLVAIMDDDVLELDIVDALDAAEGFVEIPRRIECQRNDRNSHPAPTLLPNMPRRLQPGLRHRPEGY